MLRHEAEERDEECEEDSHPSTDLEAKVPTPSCAQVLCRESSRQLLAALEP